MDYVKFGCTGLKVSRLGLGCMAYGEPGRGSHGWTLDEKRSFLGHVERARLMA